METYIPPPKPPWRLTYNDRRFLRSLRIDPEERTMGTDRKGVALTPPPKTLLADATRIVAEMAAQLPPGAQGGVIGIATEDGWNAAVVHRAGDRFEVGAWLGKRWSGKLTGGAAVRASW